MLNAFNENQFRRWSWELSSHFSALVELGTHLVGGGGTLVRTAGNCQCSFAEIFFPSTSAVKENDMV